MNVSYKYFVAANKYRWCWACGRDGRQRPKHWGAPWYLQRAHLGSSSGVMLRKTDIRVVNILCPLCHDLHCNLHEKTICGEVLPCLSNANMLWLKQVMDPVNWDEEYLRALWIGIPPEPEPLHSWFEHEYLKRRYERPRKKPPADVSTEG